MGWSSVLSFAGSLLGGTAESTAGARSAAESAIWQQWATEEEERRFKEAMEMGRPYREAGLAGMEAYGDVPMGLTEEDILRMEEGAGAMRAMQAAQGRRKAGGSAEQLGEYASGFIGDVYNRAYQDMIARANIGSRFATGAAQEAMGAGQDIASSYISGAQNIAPYIAAQGAQRSNTIAGISRLGGDLLNMAQMGGGSGPVAGEDFMYGETF